MIFNEIVIPIGSGQNFLRSLILEAYVTPEEDNYAFYNNSQMDAGSNEYFSSNYHVLWRNYNYLSPEEKMGDDYFVLARAVVDKIKFYIDEINAFKDFRHEQLLNYCFSLQNFPGIECIAMLWSIFYDTFLLQDEKPNKFQKRLITEIRNELTIIAQRFYQVHKKLDMDIIYTTHWPLNEMINVVPPGHMSFALIPKTKKSMKFFLVLQHIKHRIRDNMGIDETDYSYIDDIVDAQFGYYETFFNKGIFSDTVYYEDIFVLRDKNQIRKLFSFFGVQAVDYFDSNENEILKKIKKYHEKNINSLTNNIGSSIIKKIKLLEV